MNYFRHKHTKLAVVRRFGLAHLTVASMAFASHANAAAQPVLEMAIDANKIITYTKQLTAQLAAIKKIENLSDKLKGTASTDGLCSMIDKHTLLNRIALMILKPEHRSAFTIEQKQKYLQLAKTHFAITMAVGLNAVDAIHDLEYEVEHIEKKTSASGKDYHLARVQVRAPTEANDPIELTLVIHIDEIGQFALYDSTSGGISITTGPKSSYNSTIARAGIEGLFTQLTTYIERQDSGYCE